MRYETFKFIIANKDKFPYEGRPFKAHYRRYNSATGTQTDNSTDPGADKININAYLANDIGKSNLINILLIVLLILMIIYFFKKDFLTAIATIDIA